MARKQRAGFEVYLDAQELGPLAHVGTLHGHETRADVPAAFAYADAWIASGHAFMLDPRLELWRGDQHPARGATAFGIFMDSSPDRWGRVLMERREALKSRSEGRPPRTLRELDFLIGVHDLTRSGALRFKSTAGGPYLDDSKHSAPPITSLPELAAIARRIEEPGVDELPEYEKWLATLLAPGSSLGGARPKASFTDAKQLWIAKFPSRDDRYDVGAWELVVHRLAAKAGITVPPSQLQRFGGGHATFCVARFDRMGTSRRMFASAATVLDREGHDGTASYLDLAQWIAEQGAANSIAADLEQLFRRVLFNILVANRDDHLRNHGFIREATGWRLSPAYDLNLNPYRAEHVLMIDEKLSLPDVALALETADLYRLSAGRANAVLSEVRTAIETWPVEAKAAGLGSDELARIGPLFAV